MVVSCAGPSRMAGQESQEEERGRDEKDKSGPVDEETKAGGGATNETLLVSVESMMIDMVGMRSSPKLLAVYVGLQLGKDGSVQRRGDVANALKGSGVVQELAAALESHRVMDYLTILVEKVGSDRPRAD